MAAEQLMSQPLFLWQAGSVPPLAPFDAATMIESLDERGCGLRVVFFKPESAPDRHGHVIATVDAEGAATPLLMSCEGAGEDGWPLSPPLQSLAIERRPSGSVALLVGMSGQSHWSGSFEARPGRRLVMDLACRLGSGASDWRLGSTYLVHGRHTANASRVELDLGADERLLVEFGPESEVTLTGASMVLAVRSTTQRPLRWKYSVVCG